MRYTKFRLCPTQTFKKLRNNNPFGRKSRCQNPRLRLYVDVNVVGTQNLLELARESGCKKFIFASSSSVYGLSPNVPWSEEENVLEPISPYTEMEISAGIIPTLMILS